MSEQGLEQVKANARDREMAHGICLAGCAVDGCIFTKEPFAFEHDIAAALAQARAEEREACARVSEKWADAVPVDVFPDPPSGQHGKTVDACSARAYRHATKRIAAAIRARGEEP